MAAEESNEWMAAQARVDRARGLFQSGKLEEAAMEIRRALATDPERGDWHHNLAVTLDALGRHAEAMASYERALELTPNHPHALIGAAQGSLRRGQPAACVKYCERAVRIDSSMEPAYSLRILSLGMQGKFEEAESVYFLAQQYLTEMPLCLAEMATVLANQGKFERAVWCYREAISQNPKLGPVKTRLGVVLLKSGQPEAAHQVLLQAFREQPGDAATMLALGTTLEAMGRPAEAEEKYRHLAELEPANPMAHLRLGDLALRAGRLEDARAAYTLVLSLGLRDVPFRLRLVEVLSRMGRRSDARRHLEELFGSQTASAYFPPDATIAYGAAGAALECGTPTVAARLMEFATQLAPSDQKCWRRLARAKYELGDRKGARRATRRALAIDRNCADTLHNVALDALRNKELRRAAAAINRGMRAAPSDEGIRKLRLQVMAARLMNQARRMAAKLSGMLSAIAAAVPALVTARRS